MSFGRKAAIAVAAFATVGSTLFGGVALAGDDKGHGHHPRKDDKKVSVEKAGDGGDGGYAPNNCFQPADFGSGTLVDIDLFRSLGILGGDIDASQRYYPTCVSNAPGGAGGDVD